MSKTVTDKQIETNRRNAKRSTGPSTPEAKERVKWNALKHGLLAKSIVVPVRNVHEKAEDFESLLLHLQEELNPVGILEEMLVEEIAVTYWRKRRAVRAESGEIAGNILSRRRYRGDTRSGDLCLPTDSAVARISRYEIAIDRRLHKAIDRLTRLQGERCGK
jgi:hypothetical protein